MTSPEERRRLKKEYGELFARVSAALFKSDPVGLDFGDNPDEYDTEAATILPRLRECKSVADVRSVIHEEFCKGFDDSTAGPAELYTEAAEDIWVLWRAQRSDKRPAQTDGPSAAADRQDR